MTTTTTDAELLPRLRTLAATSRETHEIDARQEAQEWDQARRAAAIAWTRDEIEDRFPGTLALLFREEPDHFTGYPAVYHLGWCAVAYLGEGIWLCHSEPTDPWEPRGTCPVLLVPCVCGRYRQVPIEDDYSLARELDHADAHRDVCLGDCLPSGSSADSGDEEEPF